MQHAVQQHAMCSVGEGSPFSPPLAGRKEEFGLISPPAFSSAWGSERRPAGHHCLFLPPVPGLCAFQAGACVQAL